MIALPTNQAGLDAIVEGVIETVIPGVHIKALKSSQQATLQLGDSLPVKYLVEKQFTLRAQGVEELVEHLTGVLTVEWAKTLGTQNFTYLPIQTGCESVRSGQVDRSLHSFYFTYRPLALISEQPLAVLTCSLTAITITQP